jgi:hypothetical protein
MALSPETKAALLEAAEETTKVALKEAIKVAKAFAADSESTVDDTVVAGVEMVYNSFVESLVEKINPAD